MARKLDSEYLFNKLKEIHHGKYTYHDDYKNTRTKILITCPIHGDFYQTPKRHLLGQGCPECAKEEAKDTSLNYRVFLQTAQERYGDKFTYPYIEEEYNNSHSKITIQCSKCGFAFQKIANDFICSRMESCPQCRANEREEGHKLTYDQLQSKTAYKLLAFDGEVDDREDKVTVCCEKHGNYQSLVRTLLNGGGMCKYCALEKGLEVKKLTHEDIARRIKQITHGAIEPFLEDYIDTMKPMRFKCTNCGYVFERKPNAFFSTKFLNPCPQCAKKILSLRQTKTTAEFIDDAIKVHGDKYDYSKTEYQSSDKKVLITCKTCNKTFEIEANSHLQGHGCPYHNCNASIKEKKIVEHIQSLGIDVVENDREILKGKELDIFIPAYGVAIEFDGLFWHNDCNINKDAHLIKTQLCEDKNIILIHVFEDEWIYKEKICKSYINSILGTYNQIIDAQECSISQISNGDAQIFLEENHIQGGCDALINYGLKFDDKLISVMSFTKDDCFNNQTSTYNLKRFCHALNTNVRGGALKLLKRFIEEQNPSLITVHVDRRWPNQRLYTELGFILHSVTNPQYYYVKGTKRVKQSNFNGLVELNEDLELHKIHKIYDCGDLIYELKL